MRLKDLFIAETEQLRVRVKQEWFKGAEVERKQSVHKLLGPQKHHLLQSTCVVCMCFFCMCARDLCKCRSTYVTALCLQVREQTSGSLSTMGYRNCSPVVLFTVLFLCRAFCWPDCKLSVLLFGVDSLSITTL